MKLVISNPVLVPMINKRGTIEFNGVADSSRKTMMIKYIDTCHKYNINPDNATLFAIFEFLTKIKGLI